MQVPSGSRHFAPWKNSNRLKSSQRFFSPGKNLILLALALCFLLGAQTPGRTAGHQQLKNHRLAEFANAPLAGALPGETQLHLAIGLPLRNQEAMNYLLKTLYDPKSPNYRHFLKPEKFTEMFGPTQQDYQAVVNFVKSNNLSVTKTHPNRLMVEVAGSVSDIQRAFHVNLNNYKREDGSFFYALDQEPSLDLDIPVHHISGLDNFHRMSHNYHLKNPATSENKNNLTGNTASKLTKSTGTGTGATDGSTGLYYGQDFRDAYVPSAWSNLTGAGQSVGLFEVGGYYLNDINYYESHAKPQFSAPAPISILVGGYDGTVNTSGCPDNCSNTEVSLDIEMVVSMAPGAQLVVYLGSDTSNPDVTANEIYEAIVTPPLCNEISSSWTGFGDETTANLFSEMVLQGQSFFQASTDYGAFGLNNANVLPPLPLSLSPYITAVGGTQLTSNGPGSNPPYISYVSETTWNDSNGGASGGGIAFNPYTGVNLLPIPSYQSLISMATNGGSVAARNYPDVSMVATDILLISDGFGNPPTGTGNSSWISGTSAAAPLWAAYTSLVNQQAANENFPPIGFINPAVYSIGQGPNYNSDFNDVITGNNNLQNDYTYYFSAVKGYDLCTGWGSPAGNLINDLVGAIASQPTQSSCVANGKSWNQLATNEVFEPQANFGAVSFGGQMWVLGGSLGQYQFNNDVWSSGDGVNWSLIPMNYPFNKYSPRELYACLNYNGQMWVIGGDNYNTFFSDVWSSPDGRTWNNPTANIGFTGDCVGTVFNNAMWVFSGPDECYSTKTDGSAWSSVISLPAMFGGVATMPDSSGVTHMWGLQDNGTDLVLWESDTTGLNWTQVGDTGITRRWDYNFFAYNNKLWLTDGLWAHFGGYTDYNDVYIYDPVANNWGHQSGNFPAGLSYGAVVYNGMPWLLGGTASDGYPGYPDWNSVWVGSCQPTPTPTPTPAVSGPANGSSWNHLATNEVFEPQANFGAVSFGGQMWVLGGSLGQYQFNNDVWSSGDGVNWSLIPMNYPFNKYSPRELYACLNYNGQMWVIGGDNYNTFFSDVWSSPDGRTWNNPTANIGFTGDCVGTVFNNAMWVFSGPDECYSTKTDGSAWSSVISLPAMFGGVATMPDSSGVTHMWGLQDNGTDLVLWESDTTGLNWTQVGDTGITRRWDYNFFAYNNKLWLTDGLWAHFGGYTDYNDVYIYDPVANNWGHQSGNFPAGLSYGAVVYNGMPWLLGGTASDGYPGYPDWNSVWVGLASPSMALTPTPTPKPVNLASCQTGWAFGYNGFEGVATDPAGNNFFAADDLNLDVYGGVYSGGGYYTGSFGYGALGYPMGIALDAGSNVYVTDQGNCQVFEFSNASSYSTYKTYGNGIGTGPGYFNGPSGIAVTISGSVTNVFVADTNNQRVQLDQANGTDNWSLVVANGQTPFSLPVGVALDQNSNVYVADFGTGLVQVFSPSGSGYTLLNSWNVTQGTPLVTANFIAVNNCEVFVTDGFGSVGVFDLSGNFLTAFEGGQYYGSFGNTQGIAVGGNQFFVSDSGSDILSQFGNCSFACGAPTPTPTATPTWTSTLTQSPTQTATNTPTPTKTATNTPTPTNTPTTTNTPTPTKTPTNTFTATPTHTITNTPTITPTRTNTFTPTVTRTPTWTPTKTNSPTITPTRTNTYTPTKTNTPTITRTPTWTPTKTNSPTITPTRTNTSTPTKTNTPTVTRTPTWTPTKTNSPTITPTRTPTRTSTPTATRTPTKTSTPTATPSTTSGSSAMPASGVLSNDVKGPKSTPTSTLTPAPGVLISSVIPAPSLSKAGTPVKFLYNLKKTAGLTLSVYSLTGELVRQWVFQGEPGKHTQVWDLNNQSGEGVASGLYIYAFQAYDESVKETKVGKVVVAH